MLCILVYITVVLIIKNRRDKERAQWLVKTNSLITKTIFFEEEDAPTFYLPINSRLKSLLKNSRFRQTLINELITIKKDLAGVAGENLVSLYKQLDLVKDSVKKLNNSKWHKKAKAIQELSIMQQEDYYPVLYSLTNDKNEYIRMEAQTSIVKVHGFEGLRFLNDITYPISEWHQINLLMELSTVPASEFTGIENWLKSGNDTVIIFALKLSASYHQFQLYDKIVECLNHSNPKVRLQCIRCLKEIYEDTTAFHLMKIYNNEPKNHQLEILIALREIASAESISFLERQLSSDDNQIKLAASKALFNCGDEGLETIEKHPAVSQYPLNEIVQQIKMEQVR
ncbi:MAG: HEAT repeat domain-containing protein [Sphingobacteriaceae bacterium]